MTALFRSDRSFNERQCGALLVCDRMLQRYFMSHVSETRSIMVGTCMQAALRLAVLEWIMSVRYHVIH
jgi:hypothetical protein